MRLSNMTAATVRDKSQALGGAWRRAARRRPGPQPCRRPRPAPARYSRDRREAGGMAVQLRRCRAFAGDRGYKVVTEYRDAAQSGASMDRADLQKLIAEARNGKRCAFRAVLVDDLSRLSRDLGDTWQLVFGTLAASNIRVIDCTTGMASDAAGARLTFGALALVNDTFLQLVR